MHATSYIITWRDGGDPARRANLEAVLGWLAQHSVAEVIIVEQDIAPLLGDLHVPANVRLVFAYNPGPFNKSWGFNVGARVATGSLLAFGDGDVLCPTLPQAIAACRSGIAVLRPFGGVVDLDAAESAALRADVSLITQPGFGRAPADRQKIGETLPFCGGLVLFQRDHFTLLGGWDERFLGWGGEDDAMDTKLRRGAVSHRMIAAARGFHLLHRRVAGADNPHYAVNLAVITQLQTMPDEALRRLCEVSWQLAGHRERHRPRGGVA